MDIKLAKLIKEFALEQEKPQVNKYEVTEAIRNYARIGEQLRVNNNIMDTHIPGHTYLFTYNQNEKDT